MPCNSDHLEPTARESYLKLTAELLCYAHSRLLIPTPPWVAAEARNPYTKEERLTSALCDLLGRFSDRDWVELNDKSTWYAKLLIWWNEHKAADEQRVAAEAASAEQQALRESALSKLTPAERDALGLNGED